MGKVVPFPAQKPIVSVTSDIESLIERDQWQRPLILPPDHRPHSGCSVKKCGKAYRRASTVGEVLADHIGLENWKRRLTAEGLAQRPDLVQAIHTASKREVTEIVEQAISQAGGDVASRNGTTMHALTDQLDQGKTRPKGLPPHITAMLDAYARATERFEYLDGERFIVQDKIKVAGTYDRRLRDTRDDRVYIGDVKTGQSLEHLALKTPAQVGVYAAGVHYSLDGEREEHGAERDWGLLIWLPWTENPAAALCQIRRLDLRIGRKTILEAFKVEQFRKMTADQTMPALT